MPIAIDYRLTPSVLRASLETFFELSAAKILALEKGWDASRGTPVFTVRGRYTTRGWTEWTQGFQYGSALIQFDATGDERFLEIGRRGTFERMAPHVSHVGVHDHGFNNVSTYGHLRRLMREGRLPFCEHEQAFYEMALKVSGAVQAARWTTIANGEGYIYSFNGPHSLFIDTMRSLRSLALAHQLGHRLMGENDRSISLLRRMIEHARTTATYALYFGKGRDAFDVRGRTAHESLFNLNDGRYRCPSTQQGYSPFSTWTRGLAWAILGFAEQAEFLDSLPDGAIEAELAGLPEASAKAVRALFVECAEATARRYLDLACADGIPVWDDGAPQLSKMGSYAEKRSNPSNPWEPFDSSAAAIAAQGLLRLGGLLDRRGRRPASRTYRQAGWTVARTLFSDPYLSRSPRHQGLILHSVYHRPNGWDYIAPGQKVPNGESSMWGDYHARELALMIWRELKRALPLRFFDVDPQISPDLPD